MIKIVLMIAVGCFLSGFTGNLYASCAPDDSCEPPDYSIFFTDSSGNEISTFFENQIPRLAYSSNVMLINEPTWFYNNNYSDIGESGLSDGSFPIYTGKKLPTTPINLLTGQPWHWTTAVSDSGERQTFALFTVFGHYHVEGIDEDFVGSDYSDENLGTFVVVPDGPTVTPEPASMALFVLGAGCIALSRKKKSNNIQ